MSNEEVTTVAADYMYLVILGDPDIVEEIVKAMNEDSRNKKSNKLYVSSDVDTQIDYLPETASFQRILETGIGQRRTEFLSGIDVDSDYQVDAESDVESDEKTDCTSHKKYFVMGEGVETAQCYTCGEEYTNARMLIEIEERDENFNILFPILNLDDEVNPEDLITSWVVNHNIAHVADNLSIRLVNMVGTDHDILVFAAYVNRGIRN
jgi:hypothetical protein